MRVRHHVVSHLAAAGVLLSLTGLSGCSVEVNQPEGEPPPARTLAPPLGWQPVGTPGTAEFSRPYVVGVDYSTSRSGGAAAYVAQARQVTASEFGGLSQSVSAIPYRGLRVRWRMWLRPMQVTGWAGAWLRVDGFGRVLAFDNMSTRPVRGTADWTEAEVVVDIPDSAMVLTVGALLTGAGELLIDDASIEIVGADVPVTDQLVGVAPENRPTAPGRNIPTITTLVNLDFEGSSATTTNASAMAWLARTTTPFRTAEPGGDDTDLAPLGTMLDAARLVALGESTHGTREFFQLKHRVFEYLVRNKGFTHFAIEGSWAEANEIDHYVRTGEGDARRLLSRLGFWTWNTEEVLALIEWMRAWNTTASPSQQVRFLGFDMQFASLPADTVDAFVTRAMPASADSVRAWLECLRPFRRIDGSVPRPMSEYLALGAAARTACRADLANIAQLLETYSGAESAANVRQSARVLQQWERVASATGTRVTVERDLAMADNVSWLRSQTPSGAGIMLWAHNGHVSTRAPWMGNHLRERYGDDYRAVGLLFGSGSFTAQAIPIGTGLRTFSATITPPGSMEAALRQVGGAHLMFDARQLIQPGNADGIPFRGPVTLRYIGSGYVPTSEVTYFGVRQLPDHYDHLLFIRETTASRTLPFVN
jgi:erythromycin esterase